MKERLLIAAVIAAALLLVWFGYQRRHNEMSARDACLESGGRWVAESRSCAGARPER